MFFYKIKFLSKSILALLYVIFFDKNFTNIVLLVIKYHVYYFLYGILTVHKLWFSSKIEK